VRQHFAIAFGLSFAGHCLALRNASTERTPIIGTSQPRGFSSREMAHNKMLLRVVGLVASPNDFLVHFAILAANVMGFAF
jgi:hypothetical protein